MHVCYLYCVIYSEILVAIDRRRSIAAILRAGSWQHDIVTVGGQWTAKCQRRLIQAKGKKCEQKRVDTYRYCSRVINCLLARRFTNARFMGIRDY